MRRRGSLPPSLGHPPGGLVGWHAQGSLSALCFPGGSSLRCVGFTFIFSRCARLIYLVWSGGGVKGPTFGASAAPLGWARGWATGGKARKSPQPPPQAKHRRAARPPGRRGQDSREQAGAAQGEDKAARRARVASPSTTVQQLWAMPVTFIEELAMGGSTEELEEYDATMEVRGARLWEGQVLRRQRALF